MAKAYGFGSPVDYNIGAEVITDTAAHTGRFKTVNSGSHPSTIYRPGYITISRLSPDVSSITVL